MPKSHPSHSTKFKQDQAQGTHVLIVSYRRRGRLSASRRGYLSPMSFARMHAPDDPLLKLKTINP